VCRIAPVSQDRSYTMTSTDTATATQIISLHNVVLAQYGKSSIGPLTWTLHEGEHWAMVGPIDSGKALIAQAIAGGLTPQQGRIVTTLPGLREPQMTDARAVRDQITYATFNGRPGGGASFHQARWHADLETASPTVESTLSAAGVWKQNPYEVRPEAAPAEGAPAEGALADRPAAFETRRDNIFALLEITPLLSRRLHQLSDGEWRRVQIARALLRAPRLLILDDPLTGLDQAFRKKLDSALSEIAAQNGIQLLILMSEGTEMMDTVTHILSLNRGRIVAQGPKDEVLAQSVPATSRQTNTAKSLLHSPETDAPPVIHLQDINVVHNGVQILQELDWTVRRGEKWALVGPNGAGKSALLSLILGDHPQAYANRIILFGRPRGSGESIWEIKRRIGWVSPELHRYHPPHTTPFDIVCSGYFDSIGLHRRCTDEQRTRAHRWLKRMGLEDAAHSPFRHLPKGQQRLALIARALVKDPELLILDEPCQGLDPTHLEEVLRALDEVTAEATRTLIYVTHQPSEFPSGLTHILELAGGKVVHQGVFGA